MLFSDTIETRALADAATSRLKAEARMESTKASLLRVGGYSTFVLCFGLGCSAACLGYASIKKAHSSSNEIAEILSTALNKASITTTGEVKLIAGASVFLKTGATVSVDPAAVVKVDPAGTVESLDSHPRFDPIAAPPTSGKRVSANYTVLKEIKYAKGAVMTAWTFRSSEHTTPSRQRCYYVEKADQRAASIVIELGLNGHKVLPHVPSPQIDTAAAVTNCVWFSADQGA